MIARKLNASQLMTEHTYCAETALTFYILTFIVSNSFQLPFGSRSSIGYDFQITIYVEYQAFLLRGPYNFSKGILFQELSIFCVGFVFFKVSSIALFIAVFTVLFPLFWFYVNFVQCSSCFLSLFSVGSDWLFFSL